MRCFEPAWQSMKSVGANMATARLMGISHRECVCVGGGGIQSVHSCSGRQCVSQAHLRLAAESVRSLVASGCQCQWARLPPRTACQGVNVSGPS
jgi:hypothetical protein